MASKDNNWLFRRCYPANLKGTVGVISGFKGTLVNQTCFFFKSSTAGSTYLKNNEISPVNLHVPFNWTVFN